MAHGNDAQARAAEIAGQAQARAAEQRGAAWGNAIGNIGQMIGQMPQQIAQQRRTETQDALNTIKLREAQDLRAGQTQLDVLQRGDQLPVGDVGPRAPSYLTADGLWDIPKLQQALAASGKGHLAPDLLKSAEGTNDSITKHVALDRQTAEAKAVMFGDMADGVLKLTRVGMPLEQAMDFAVQPGLATKRFTPEEYQQLKGKILALPPEQQTATLTGLMDQAAKLGGQKNLSKDAIEVDRYGRTSVSNVQPEPNKGDYTGPDGLRYHANGTPVTGQVMKPQTPPKALQSKSVMVGGKSVEAVFDPATGKLSVNGEDVTDRAQPIPPASVQIYNKTAAEGQGDISPTAKAIAEYRLPPPSARSMASGAGKALMDQVMRANPDYAADQFSRRAPMAKAFTSGPQSQAINSLNTAIGHLDQFVDVAKALDNGNFRPGNQAYNWLKATFGDSAPTNFQGITSIMAGELASAFKKSGATDQEIASVEKAINSTNSATQLIDYATKIAIPALGSKIASYNSQYRQTMGTNDPFKVLSSEAENVLVKYGFDPAHPTIGGSRNTDTGKMQKPIPGIAGGLAESTDGGLTWKRIK